MKNVCLFLFLLGLICISSCRSPSSPPPIKSLELSPIAKKFAYPIGKKNHITEKRDKKDEWYNAQDFGENNHLGEDWNANSGGNTDCGEDVYAAANGTIVYAKDAGTGWGNVIIVTHNLPNGKKFKHFTVTSARF